MARGDADTVAEHIAALRDTSPEALRAYVALARLTADRALAAGILTAPDAQRLLDVLAGAPAMMPDAGPDHGAGLAAARRRPLRLAPGGAGADHGRAARRAPGAAPPGPLSWPAPDGSVVVSIFVNPLQFGDGRGPGPLSAHPGGRRARSARRRAPTWCSRPGRSQMYPRPQLITVDPGPMGRVLEGASRPGHFAGVLTVVLQAVPADPPGRRGVR